MPLNKLERNARIAATAVTLAAALAGFGCAGNRAYRNGENDELLEQWDRAVADYARARELDPKNLRFKASFDRAKRKAAQAHFEKGKMYNNSGRPELAVVELEQTVALDPENDYAALELKRARDEAARLEKERAEPTAMEKLRAETRDARAVGPILEPASKKPISLNFPQPRPIKQIYQALGQAAGINVIFDPALKDDQATIILTNIDFKTALETLLRQENHFYKVIDPHTILIAADTPNNRKTYEDLVIRTFYLSNGDVTEVANAIRALLGTVHVSINKAENAITLRDTADKISIAQRVIEQNDKEKAEVIVDVELLQLDLNKVQTLGVQFPFLSGFQANYLSQTSGTPPVAAPFTVDLLRHLATNQFGLTVPSITADFIKTHTDASVLAKPQMRISEGEKAQLTIGKRIPIATTTFSSTFAGTTGAIAATPVTSFQYQQVGIKIEMEPRVHHNKEVTLKLTVEVSSDDGPAPGTTEGQPIIGDRTISSTIRLKDGETNFLAGLIRRDNSTGDVGPPFLSDIPIIGRLFTHTNKQSDNTDLVMTITPHIIRIPDINKDDLMPVFVGTESNISYQGAPRVEAFNEPPSPLEQKKTGKSAPVRPGGVGGVAKPTSPFFPPPQNPTQPIQPTLPPPPSSRSPFSEAQPVSPVESQPAGAPAAAASAAAASSPAAASDVPVSFRFDPNTVALSPGRESTVLLTLTGGETLSAGSVSFDYDPSVLQVETVEALAGSQSVPVSQGKIVLNLSPTPALTGSWPLAKITFKALAPGSTTIAFGENSLTDLSGNPAAASFGSVSVEVK
jgi:general secretion pathway protein D